jgi:hypothetical protein
VRFERDRSAARRGHAVLAPTSVTIGRGDELTNTKSSNTTEVMPVSTVDGEVLVE